MRLTTAIISFSLACAPLAAHAITNIESKRKSADQQGLKGELQLSVSGKSGNSDKQTSSATGRLDYRREQHQVLAIVSSEYGESKDVKDTDNNFAHLRYIHHESPRFAWEGFLQYQDDAFKLLDSRTLAGAGARFDLSPDDESFQLRIGVGGYYTEEVYQLEDTEVREDYARGNAYVSYFQQLTPSASISNTLYWQPRLSQPSDSYLYNNLAIKVDISQRLALQVTLESQYDSDPVADLEHTDHSYFTSLVFSF